MIGDRNTSLSDLYMRAYQQAMQRQDAVIEKIKPGKTQLRPALSDEEFLRRHETIVGDDPQKLLRLAAQGCISTGMRPTTKNIFQYAQQYIKAVNKARKKVR